MARLASSCGPAIRSSCERLPCGSPAFVIGQAVEINGSGFLSGGVSGIVVFYGKRRQLFVKQIQPIDQLFELLLKLAFIFPFRKIQNVILHHLFHNALGPGAGLPAIIESEGA
jgi:hypothetical protein